MGIPTDDTEAREGAVRFNARKRIPLSETVPPHAQHSRLRVALAVIALLIVSNIMSNRILPTWAYLPWNLTVAITLVFMARRAGLGFAGIGLGFRQWHRPVGVGLILVSLTAFVLALAMSLPVTRDAFLDGRAAGTSTWGMLYQVLIRIPFGTVVLEEIAFRGVLPALFGASPSVRWKWKPVLGASALFGLWHLLPSSALTNGNAAVHDLLNGSAIATTSLAILSTMLLGIVMCWITYLGRGLKTTMLLHWATNSLGFVAAWLAIN